MLENTIEKYVLEVRKDSFCNDLFWTTESVSPYGALSVGDFLNLSDGSTCQTYVIKAIEHNFFVNTHRINVVVNSAKLP